jgi:hypothetical protein
MFVQAKYSILVEPNPFEHTISIKDAMIENRDLSLGLLVKCAVDIDFQVHVGWGVQKVRGEVIGD